MTIKRWISLWLITVFFIVVSISIINYIIDPYRIYNKSIFSFPKIKQDPKIRLVKAIKTKNIKPKSIILGTSRAEFGFDPQHPYFKQPSYNLATGGSTMYETRLYFEYALLQGNLEDVLLVLDYRMFNFPKQKSVNEFESYFKTTTHLTTLISITSFVDSIYTIIGNRNLYEIYLDNGQKEHSHRQLALDKVGGHMKMMLLDESDYYKGYPTNYLYSDTRANSFDDFMHILEKCYKNNIHLDIILGPSHIRQWEALDYYLGYDKWLQWKKDVVLSVNKIAKEKKKKQFRIMDFSVYHPLTAEKVPSAADKDSKMKYYWDSSHYKNELGLIVLDRLLGKSEFKDFGVELNLQNIYSHLEQQSIKRYHHINTKEYQMEVWRKLKE